MRIQLLVIILLTCLSWNPLHAQVEDTAAAEMSVNDKLLIAADAGDTVTVSRLIRVGGDVDAVTSEGVTPLMYATQNGNLAMMKLLIRGGADPDKKPSNGFTALITAVRNGDLELAELLIRSGASVDLSDNSNMSPLMHAIVADSFYMPDLLLYYEASFEPKRWDGMDALMLASWLGRYEIASELISLGANINSSDKTGRTPLHFAAMAGHNDIIELLIHEGASLESMSTTGMTPLAAATLKNNYESVRLLIGAGANVNVRISNSLNPLALAQENGHDSLTAMLRNNGARVILWPWFDKVTFGGRCTFNREDVLVGINLGLSDKKYNLWTSFGYDIRPAYLRILEPAKGNNYFQYWERRHLISFSLEKAFLLTGKNEKNKGGLVTGFQEAMTFGSYRGSYLGPESRIIFSPRVGAVYQHNYLRFRLTYTYMNLHLVEMSRNWCIFSVELLFNRNKGYVK